MRLIAISFAGCFLLASCSTVSVSRDKGDDPGDTESVPGIPFYVKHLKTQQETKWSETTHDVEVTVAATDNDGNPLPRSSWTSTTVNVPDSLMLGAEMNDLRKAVLEFSDRPTLPQADVPAAIRELASVFEALRLKAVEENAARADRPNGLPRDQDVRLVSNKLTEELIVDTSKKYYANGRHPAVGTGKANFELNADMTLTKVESEVSDETLKTFLGLLPIEEFFTKQWALTGPVDPDSDPTPTGITLRVSLNVKPKITVYRLSKDSSSIGAPIPVTAANVAGNSFEMSVVKPSKSDGKKKDDKNTVKVDATVMLPPPTSDK